MTLVELNFQALLELNFQTLMKLKVTLIELNFQTMIEVNLMKTLMKMRNVYLHYVVFSVWPFADSHLDINWIFLALLV